MTIIERVQKYDFSKLKFSQIERTKFDGKKFAIKLKIKDLPKNNERKVLIRAPYFTVYGVRLNYPRDLDKFTNFELRDKVQIYADNNGDLYLIEVLTTYNSPYQTESKSTSIELLLNTYNAKKDYAYIFFDGIKIGWVFNSEVVNCDYVFGEIQKINPNNVIIDDDVKAYITTDLKDLKILYKNEKSKRSFNFYSPKGYNAWAGDAINFYHDGAYHLLYLYDRHHHGSRWDSGAHVICHFVTRDFNTWRELPLPIDITEQWQSVGTGTMFFHNGKYYIAHGWHTSRIIPEEKTGNSLLKGDKENTKMHPIYYDELREKGLYLSGANFLKSKDGVNFEPGNCMFHISENPSVYEDANGSLFMYGGYGSSGIWRANEIDGEWYLDDKSTVLQSDISSNSKCPSLFECNGYKYLLMGRTGYWKTEKNCNEYIDEAIKGFDIYDGLSYPMVTVTEDKRIIMAGWIRNGTGINNWGSVIIHRELIQDNNGRLFMKWLKELSPNVKKLKAISKNQSSVVINPKQSYYIEFNVKANDNTKTFVEFGGDAKSMLIIDAKRKTIQINDDDSEVLPLFEIIKEGKDRNVIGNLHCQGENFAIGQVDNIQSDYKVKIQLYYERKLDNAIIDCEIGEKRTLVSNRLCKKYSEIQVYAENGNISNLIVYENKNNI